MSEPKKLIIPLRNFDAKGYKVSRSILYKCVQLSATYGISNMVTKESVPAVAASLNKVMRSFMDEHYVYSTIVTEITLRNLADITLKVLFSVNQYVTKEQDPSRRPQRIITIHLKPNCAVVALK